MNVSLSKLAIAAMLLVGSVGVVKGCGIEWRVPVNHFEGVNQLGEFSIWREIGQIDFGENLKLPLIIGFTPTRGGISCLGRGWIVPILDANIVQVDEKRFLLTQPDGINRQFWRKKPTDSDLKGQGNWAGEIRGYTIDLWADCGWKLSFFKGKLVSITTPKNRVLNVVYVNGQATEIQERGKPALRVESDSTGMVTGFRFGTNYIPVRIGERPTVASIQDTNVITGKNQSLHTLNLSGTSQTIYEFGVDEKVQPTLNISGDTFRSFTWDASTGRLLKDGKWNYDIKLGTERWPNAEIRRTNFEKQSEYWFNDAKGGKEIIQGIDGKRVTKTWFTSGPIAKKMRTITEDHNGVTSTLFQAFYDDRGNLVRIIQKDGSVTTYGYDKYGNQISEKKDGKILWEKIFDASGLVVSESTSYGEKIERKRLPSREIERITYSKTLKLVDTLKNDCLIKRVFPNNETQYFYYNSTGGLTTMIDPSGNRWDYRFASTGENSETYKNGKLLYKVFLDNTTGLKRRVSYSPESIPIEIWNMDSGEKIRGKKIQEMLSLIAPME